MCPSKTILLIFAIIGIYFLVRENDFHIYHIGDTRLPQVAIIAGTHGNEPAPALYLEELARHLERHPEELPTDVHFAIVPRVNAAAISRGVRSVEINGHLSDYNRCWPDPDGKFCSPIRDLVDGSQLIIDIHEAWGTETQAPGSLGQTIFTTDERLRPLVAQTIQQLNQLPVAPWQEIRALPAVESGTTLDQYCAGKIPYVLIEIAGQHDIVAPETRRTQCREALAVLTGVKTPK